MAIIFASCAEQKQEPKNTAGYSIRGEDESYMIGSDETTDFIRK